MHEPRSSLLFIIGAEVSSCLLYTSDVEEVGANVLASEPHLALFADRDGYAIYEKIAQQAPSVLTPDGKIYLEIGYKQGAKVKELFQEAFPNKRVRVLKDQFGQDRMVVVDNGSH